MYEEWSGVPNAEIHISITLTGNGLPPSLASIQIYADGKESTHTGVFLPHQVLGAGHFYCKTSAGFTIRYDEYLGEATLEDVPKHLQPCYYSVRFTNKP